MGRQKRLRASGSGGVSATAAEDSEDSRDGAAVCAWVFVLGWFVLSVVCCWCK